MNRLNFAHLDSAMRIVRDADGDVAAAEEPQPQPEEALPPASPAKRVLEPTPGRADSRASTVDAEARPG